MKLPVLHNFNAIKGEVISLSIGYNNVVASESLFACVRKYSPDEEYKAKFDIDVSTDELENDEASKITLSLDTNALAVGKYQRGLFIWNGDRPIKCLVKGQVNVVATLPPNSPVAVRLIEKSVNVNNNSVYVERNSRMIKAWGVPVNTRYIIDIIGYWRKV